MIPSINIRLLGVIFLITVSIGSAKCKETPLPLPPTDPTPIPAATFEREFEPGRQPYHQTGIRNEERDWEANLSHPASQFLTYGPYIQDVPAGNSTAIFTLQVDNVSNDRLTILTLDVYDSAHDKILAARELKRTDFRKPQHDQDFSVGFHQGGRSNLEFRVFWHGHSSVRHSKTRVINQAVDFTRDPMGALWSGHAHFQYLRTIDWPRGESSGWTAVKDGRWYIFNRDTDIASQRPPSCAGLDYARSIVRYSDDQGKSWSAPVVVVEPQSDNTYSDCAILDGSSYFDRDTGTWHLLAQCLGSSAAWRLCHYTRHDPSPMGLFTPNSQNPAVEPGDLWRPICQGHQKSCPSTIIDEGTPDILFKQKGYYYVTFHGYDPGPQTGYRGLARTTNFINWETSGGDLPGDAIFTARDCQFWNPGCIGGGESTTIVSGSYHYMIIEAPDKSLLCTNDQFWAFGLMRAPAFSKSGAWESFARNPLLTPSRRRPCGLQYARLIQDDSKVFLLYEDLEKGRRLFELQRGAGTPLIE